jgi:Mg2+-importing ATPase
VAWAADLDVLSAAGTTGLEGTRPPAVRLAACAATPPLVLLRQVGTGPSGLTEAEAQARLVSRGENTAGVPGRERRARDLLASAASPFTVLLLGLAVASAVTGSRGTTALIAVLVLVSWLLRFRQQRRSGRAAAALRELIATTATVRRRAAAGIAPAAREVPVDQLVPGDIVQLGPGDLVPADLVLLRAAGLAVSQALLTGESSPAVKHAVPAAGLPAGPGRPQPGREPAMLDCPWLCPAGGSVLSGTGTGVVVATGAGTYFATTHGGAPRGRAETCFERGIRGLSWTLLRYLAAGTGLVLAVTLARRGTAPDVLLLVVAVAVGLTPEMLPVVVDAALTRGARAVARLGVIVKRLPALHNLGAMDVLCLDKTGTLTEGRLAPDFWVGPSGHPEPAVLRAACRNSVWSAAGGEAVPDALDEALLKVAADLGLLADQEFTGAGQVPFEAGRRRASVVLRRAGRPGPHLMITKGAPAEVLACCARVRTPRGSRPLDAAGRARLQAAADRHAAAGTRLIAVATAEIAPRPGRYRPADEAGLVFAGFVGFRDQPRESAAAALRSLAAAGIGVRVISGDHPLVTAHACRQAGLDPGRVVLGREVDAMTDEALGRAASAAVAFAWAGPEQKARIVRALRAAGHTVGFLGDGANDAPALRAADVGIAAESAVELARESASVILARKDLTVLAEAVRQGRRSFGNIVKYLRVTLSANVGNVTSMLAASLVLPFLPMLPVQVLLQNACSDLAQLGLAFDRVDERAMRRPRTFGQRDLTAFVACFGLLNTAADLVTFVILWRLGTHAGTPGRIAVFRAGWFTENLLSQALAVLMLRGGAGPSRRSRPAWPVLLGVAAMTVAGLALPASPLAARLGMQPPPLAYLPLLTGVLAGYAALLAVARRSFLSMMP